MKTGKLIWGLILIFVGLILLLSNFGVIHFYWGVIWRFWPVIFVLIGINILFSQRNPLWGTILAILVTIFSLIFIAYRGTHVHKHSHHWWWGEMEDEKDSYFYPNSSFSEPYILGTNKAELNINGGATSYRLSDTTSNLFDADIKQNYGSYTLEKMTRGSTEILRFRMRDGKVKWDIDTTNEASLRLNTRPSWTMNVEIGAGKTDFDLSKFKVEKLTLKGGVAVFHVKLGLSQPFSAIHVEAGVAKVVIQVPIASSCRIQLDSGLSSRNFEGFTKQKDGTYLSDNYAGLASHRVDIHLAGGLSTFEVSRY